LFPFPWLPADDPRLAKIAANPIEGIGIAIGDDGDGELLFAALTGPL
jgi:hypothetical protein